MAQQTAGIFFFSEHSIYILIQRRYSNNVPCVEYRYCDVLQLSPANNSAGTAVSLSSATVPDSSVCIRINGSGSNDQVARKTFGTSPTVRMDPLLRTALQVLPVTLDVLVGGTWRNDQQYLHRRSAYSWLDWNSERVFVDSATTMKSLRCSDLPMHRTVRTIRTKPSSKEHSQIMMAGVAVNMNPFVGLLCPFTVSADFVNNGAASITGADINYSVNGGIENGQ